MRPAIIPRVPRDAALAYADLGVKVFRVRRDKAPYGNCEQCRTDKHRPEDCACGVDTCHGFHAATTDPETIRRWWTEEPHANIGAPCKLNGWAVVDIDPRNGGYRSLIAVEQRAGVLPGTVMQVTGGDGLHLLYRDPECRLPATPFPGIDFKHNGYVLLAPSVNSSGVAYRWAGDGLYRHPVTPWPANLKPREPKPKPTAPVVVRPRRTSGPRDHIAELVQQVMDAAAGTRHGRNNSLYTASCRAHFLADRGVVDLNEARDALLDAARAVNLDGGQRQAEDTFDSAANRPRRNA